MPRYFIDTFDSIVVIDDVGQDLQDEDAVREVVRKTLAGMLRDEHKERPAAQYRAEVRDEAGKRVLTGSVLIVIEKAPERKVVAATDSIVLDWASLVAQGIMSERGFDVRFDALSRESGLSQVHPPRSFRNPRRRG